MEEQKRIPLIDRRGGGEAVVGEVTNLRASEGALRADLHTRLNPVTMMQRDPVVAEGLKALAANEAGDLVGIDQVMYGEARAGGKTASMSGRIVR